MTIAAAFDRAADYDRHAVVQARVVRRLAEMLADEALPAGAHVLEIGCGTGLLGAALIDRLPGASWLMTDIAPAMVARTAARFEGRPNVEVAIMDGEHPTGDTRYDLICSSLAMQWFDDLPAAVRRLRERLAPGGLLAFTTLVDGSFAEWRAALGDRRAGTPDYPPPGVLERLGLTVTIERHRMKHDNARHFLRTLKQIGAGTPRPGYAPLPPAELREAMTRFEAGGAATTYVVATCRMRCMEEA